MGKYSLEDIERMTTKKSRVSDRTSENGRRQTNIPALESRELVRKQEVSNATKKVSDTILGDEHGNNWLTKILNPGGAIDKLGESIEAAGKSALYNIPGAKTFAKAIDKYVDPLLGTNLVDSEAMEAEVNELAKEHKVASALGNVGGNMAMSVVGGQALNAIPMVGKLSGQAANTLANTVTGGKLSQAAVDAGAKHLKNVLGDAVFDVTADTLPQMVNAAMDGKGAEVGKIGVENTLQNLAFNAGGEMAGMAIDSLKGIRNKNRIPQLGDLSEETEQVAKSSTDIPNVDVQSPEQVSEAVNEIPALKNVDEMAEGAKKNARSVENNAKQNQSKTSQETVETAMKPEYNMGKEVGGVEDAGEINTGTGSVRERNVYVGGSERGYGLSGEGTPQRGYRSADSGVDSSLFVDPNKGVARNAGEINTGTGSIRERNVERLKQVRSENSGQMESQGVFGSQDSGASSGFRIIPDSVRNEINNLGVTNNEFRDMTNNPELFSFALESGKRSNTHGAMVDSHTAEELTESGAFTFLAKNNMAGGAVMPDGNITAVFKAKNSKAVGASKDIIVTALENGGDRLDCYGEKLVDMYSKAGFENVVHLGYNIGKFYQYYK